MGSNIETHRRMMKLLVAVLVLASSLSVWAAPQPGAANPTIAAEDAFVDNMRTQQQVKPLMGAAMAHGLRRTGSGSTAAASGSSTPAPTAIAGSTRIVQVATVTHIANAAAYTGATKVLFERAYGKMLGICANTACSSYKAGGHVTSVASDTAFRRGTVYIQFTSTVAPADAAAAQTAATAFTTAAGQQTFVTGMAAIKAADTAQFGAVTVPTAAQVTGLAPTVTTVGGTTGNSTTGGGGPNSFSGAASERASWFRAVGLAVLALRQ